ncbi:unnamed protein product [Vicia faba]|uniref:Uncharacterized protein n=1 Tax=Vicia faba TaxID=3906 RepID=A0AAV1B9U9_VICFA|nr:unnamed protein product [Vicia faba]
MVSKQFMFETKNKKFQRTFLLIIRVFSKESVRGLGSSPLNHFPKPNKGLIYLCQSVFYHWPKNVFIANHKTYFDSQRKQNTIKNRKPACIIVKKTNAKGQVLSKQTAAHDSLKKLLQS